MLALSIACTAAAAVWAYLVLGHGGYWRTGQRLPPTRAEAAAEPAAAEQSAAPATPSTPSAPTTGGGWV